MEVRNELHTGFYSALAAKNYGSFFWVDTEGAEYEITAIVDDTDANSYKWTDKMLVSTKLVRYLRGGKPGNNGNELLQDYRW